MFGRIARRVIAASLVALAAPVAAQVAPPPLDAYGELPAIEDMAVSPSGQIAMLATSSGKRILAMLDPALQPIRVLEVGDIKVRGFRWIGDDAIMIQRSETIDLDERFLARSAEIFNVMIVPVDPQEQIRTVFADERDMVHAVFGNYGFRQLGGKWTGLFAGRAMARQLDGTYYYEGGKSALYAVDLAANKSRRMTTAPTSNEYADWLVDEQGKVTATLHFTETNYNWRLLNARDRQIASGNSPKGGAWLVAFGAGGDTAIYAITPEHGPARYYEVPLDGGAEPTELWPDLIVETVYSNPNTSRMIGYLPEGHAGEADPIFGDAEVQARVSQVLDAFRPFGGVAYDWTPGFGRIVVHTGGNNDSGTWFLIDTERGQSTVIGKARPQIGPTQVGPISTIHYAARDGLELEAILTLPPGREAKGLPLVMLPHGGPRAHDDEIFDWWAQAFASRGYAVLQPNFRGSTEHGEEFMHAGDGEWGKKMQTDLSDGMVWLADQGIVDPARACIVGASYGGYAALAGVTLQQGLYRCAVSVAGVSDLKLFFEREYRESGRSRETRDDWLEMMGPRGELDTVSPRAFAARADAPILLIHGRDDTVVPFEQSTKMADSLLDAGKPVEFVELQGEDHWLSRSDTRKQMLQAAVAFVEEHNPAD